MFFIRSGFSTDHRSSNAAPNDLNDIIGLPPTAASAQMPLWKFDAAGSGVPSGEGARRTTYSCEAAGSTVREPCIAGRLGVLFGHQRQRSASLD